MRDPSLEILVVDDNPKLGRLVSELFNRIGFAHVDTATNGAEALEMLRTGNYGLVVSDLEMSPMDGLQLLKQVKSSEELFRTAFILTEASITFEQVTTAHAYGVDAFLLKPFDLTLLKTKLKTVLGRRARRKKIALDWASAEVSDVA